MDLAPVLDAVSAALPRWRTALAELVAIPSISREPAPSPALAESARRVRALLEAAGLEHGEVITLDGHHPFVYADRLHRPGAPTLLVYAHHDVMPPGDLARWSSPPWTLTPRDGRLYGRGAADDKAGIVVHAAAVAAWLEVAGELPLNLRILVDGEEEVSSPALPRLLATRPEQLRADVVAITDTANLETGLPCLTTSLRGLVAVVVEVEALAGPLHSGMWGGAVPDATLALAGLLARLVDHRGTCRVPLPPPRAHDATALGRLPFDEAAFRKDAGLLEGIPLAGSTEAHPYARLWHGPAVSVNAFESHPLAGSTNQIVASARARVGLRLAPGQDPDAALGALIRLLTEDPPQGVRVRVRPEEPGSPWAADPDGPAFAAALRALETGFGRPAAVIGCGATIPVVAPFAAALPGAPVLLLGIEDPPTRAHAEDESVHEGDLVASMRAAAALYAELAVTAR